MSKKLIEVLDVASFLNMCVVDTREDNSYLCKHQNCNRSLSNYLCCIDTNDGYSITVYTCRFCNRISLLYEPSNMQELKEKKLCHEEALKNGISLEKADKCTFAEIGCPNCFLTKGGV